jgi:hypothetical protein
METTARTWNQVRLTGLSVDLDIILQCDPKFVVPTRMGRNVVSIVSWSLEAIPSLKVAANRVADIGTPNSQLESYEANGRY